MLSKRIIILLFVTSAGLLCLGLIYVAPYFLNFLVTGNDSVPVKIAARLPSVERTAAQEAPTIVKDQPPTIIKKNWKSYTTAMRRDGTRALAFDQNGMLWTVGSGGAVRWDFANKAYTKYTTEHGIVSNNLFSITIAPDGTIWVGGESGGIATFDGKTWVAYKIAESAWFNEVHALFVNPDKTTWAGVNDQGLYTLTGHHSNRIVDPGAPAYEDVSTIFKASDGSFWIGICGNDPSDSVTGSGGVYHYDGKTWKHFDRETGLGSNVVLGIAENPSGKIWLATQAGLAQFDGSTWLNYTTDSGLLDDGTSAVIKGQDQSVWVATRKGLSRFDGKEWVNYNLGFAVHSLTQGPDESIWFSSDQGLHSLANDIIHTYHTQDYLLGNGIINIDITPDNVIWCRTEQVGLVRYQSTNSTLYNVQDGLADELVLSIQPAAGGIWFGTDNGISFYNGTEWQTVTPSQEKSNRYQVVYADPQGKIWAAAGTKAWAWDGIEWKPVFHKENEVNRIIRGITVGSDNSIWFATGDGVSRFDGQNWLDFSTEDGLTSKYVEDLITAKDGSIWAGTSFGIVRFDGRKWETVDDTESLYMTLSKMLAASDGSIWIATFGHIIQFDPQGNRHIYTSLDGLGSDMVWDLAEAPDGSIWFASASGFTQYIP